MTVPTRVTDNLVRLAPGLAAIRAALNGRADAERAVTDLADMNTLFGHFAVFDVWTEIKSWYEGNFLERIARGAFAESFSDRRSQIRCLFDHGYDPQVGNKPLGTPDVLREEKIGAYYEVGLFDAGYVNQLKPALAAAQMGASFRFRVTGETWVEPTEPTDHNPGKLQERTITNVVLYEFGPVVFPAYAEASAGLRSGSDEFLERLTNDPAFVQRFIERVGPAHAAQLLTTVAGTAPTPPAIPAGPAPERATGGRPVTDLTLALANAKASPTLLRKA